MIIFVPLDLYTMVTTTVNNGVCSLDGPTHSTAALQKQREQQDNKMLSKIRSTRGESNL